MEIYVSCKKDNYDFYNELNKYFQVEILEDDNNTMGIGEFKIFIEPISKAIETLGNIITSIINVKRTSITVKNGDKEFTFEGNLSELNNGDVKEILEKLLEV